MTQDNYDEPNEEFRKWFGEKVFAKTFMTLKANVDKVINDCGFVYSREAAYAIKSGISLKAYIQRLSDIDIHVLLNVMLSSDDISTTNKTNYSFLLLSFEGYHIVAESIEANDVLSERVDHIISTVVLLRTEMLRRTGKIDESMVQYTLFPNRTKVEEILNQFEDVNTEEPEKKKRKPRKKPIENQ